MKDFSLFGKNGRGNGIFHENTLGVNRVFILRRVLKENTLGEYSYAENIFGIFHENTLYCAYEFWETFRLPLPLFSTDFNLSFFRIKTMVHVNGPARVL